MARKLSQMTWADIQHEMSIAEAPEKVTELGAVFYTVDVLVDEGLERYKRLQRVPSECVVKPE